MRLVYRMEPGRSRLSAHTSASGLLSFLGHSPTFAVREFAGQIWLDSDHPDKSGVEITIRADSLSVVDDLKQSDRAEIECRMRQEVLETESYPDVVFQSSDLTAIRQANGSFQCRIQGELKLHGVRGEYTIDARMVLDKSGLHLTGGRSVNLSDHGIKPVTAVGGTIRLKDQVRVEFDLFAVRTEET